MGQQRHTGAKLDRSVHVQAEQILSADAANESNGDDDEDWAPELLICIAGLAAALTGKAGNVSAHPLL